MDFVATLMAAASTPANSPTAIKPAAGEDFAALLLQSQPPAAGNAPPPAISAVAADESEKGEAGKGTFSGGKAATTAKSVPDSKKEESHAGAQAMSTMASAWIVPAVQTLLVPKAGAEPGSVMQASATAPHNSDVAQSQPAVTQAGTVAGAPVQGESASSAPAEATVMQAAAKAAMPDVSVPASASLPDKVMDAAGKPPAKTDVTELGSAQHAPASEKVAGADAQARPTMPPSSTALPAATASQAKPGNPPTTVIVAPNDIRSPREGNPPKQPDAAVSSLQEFRPKLIGQAALSAVPHVVSVSSALPQVSATLPVQERAVSPNIRAVEKMSGTTASAKNTTASDGGGNHKSSAGAANPDSREAGGKNEQPDSQPPGPNSTASSGSRPVDPGGNTSARLDLGAAQTATSASGHTSTANASPLPASHAQAAVAENPAPVPHSSPLVNSAMLRNLSSGSEVRVGMRVGEFGNVEIRTQMQNQQLKAEVSVEHHELGHALTAEMPALQQSLHDHNVPLSSVAVLSHSGAGGGGFQGEARRQQPAFLGAPAVEFSAVKPELTSVPEETNLRSGLDIRV